MGANLVVILLKIISDYDNQTAYAYLKMIFIKLYKILKSKILILNQIMDKRSCNQLGCFFTLNWLFYIHHLNYNSTQVFYNESKLSWFADLM